MNESSVRNEIFGHVGAISTEPFGMLFKIEGEQSLHSLRVSKQFDVKRCDPRYVPEENIAAMAKVGMDLSTEARRHLEESGAGPARKSNVRMQLSS